MSFSCHIDVNAAFFYYKRIISSRPYKRDQRKYQGSKANHSHNICVREALLKITHSPCKYWPIIRGSQKTSFNKLKRDRKINKREFEVDQVGEVLTNFQSELNRMDITWIPESSQFFKFQLSWVDLGVYPTYVHPFQMLTVLLNFS